MHLENSRNLMIYVGPMFEDEQRDVHSPQTSFPHIAFPFQPHSCSVSSPHPAVAKGTQLTPLTPQPLTKATSLHASQQEIQCRKGRNMLQHLLHLL